MAAPIEREQIGTWTDNISPVYLEWIDLHVSNNRFTNKHLIIVEFCVYPEINGEAMNPKFYSYTCRDGEALRTINQNIIADTDSSENMLKIQEIQPLLDENGNRQYNGFNELITHLVDIPKPRLSEFTKNINFFRVPIYDPVIKTMSKKYLELIPYQL